MSEGVVLLAMTACHLLIFPTASSTKEFRILGSSSILPVDCVPWAEQPNEAFGNSAPILGPISAKSGSPGHGHPSSPWWGPLYPG